MGIFIHDFPELKSQNFGVQQPFLNIIIGIIFIIHVKIRTTKYWFNRHNNLSQQNAKIKSAAG
jgi:hypothetical protein